MQEVVRFDIAEFCSILPTIRLDQGVFDLVILLILWTKIQLTGFHHPLAGESLPYVYPLPFDTSLFDPYYKLTRFHPEPP